MKKTFARLDYILTDIVSSQLTNRLELMHYGGIAFLVFLLSLLQPDASSVAHKHIYRVFLLPLPPTYGISPLPRGAPYDREGKTYAWENQLVKAERISLSLRNGVKRKAMTTSHSRVRHEYRWQILWIKHKRAWLCQCLFPMTHGEIWIQTLNSISLFTKW